MPKPKPKSFAHDLLEYNNPTTTHAEYTSKRESKANYIENHNPKYSSNLIKENPIKKKPPTNDVQTDNVNSVGNVESTDDTKENTKNSFTPSINPKNPIGRQRTRSIYGTPLKNEKLGGKVLSRKRKTKKKRKVTTKK